MKFSILVFVLMGVIYGCKSAPTRENKQEVAVGDNLLTVFDETVDGHRVRTSIYEQIMDKQKFRIIIKYTRDLKKLEINEYLCGVADGSQCMGLNQLVQQNNSF